MPKKRIIKSFADIPNYELGEAPESCTGIEYRLATIKRAMRAGYEVETPEECSGSIKDAISDLMHLCDLMRLDFDRLTKQAYINYLDEKNPTNRIDDECD